MIEETVGANVRPMLMLPATPVSFEISIELPGVSFLTTAELVEVLTRIPSPDVALRPERIAPYA